MHPFVLTLSNNATVAGIHSIPTPSSTSPQNRPLIVSLHGGTYDCHYFDASPIYTASVTSEAFGIPFVSIDRPCYGGTTSFLPVPAGSTFNQETGLWLHKYILPALWREFGLPNQCNSVVLLCHSFGSMGGIVAAALHAEDSNPPYPLAGLIFSGMGDKQSANMKDAPPMPPNVGSEHVLFPLAVKDNVMFRPGTVDENILHHSERLNAVSPVTEMYELKQWLSCWKSWASKVKTAVMLALVEDDVFFEATEKDIQVCTAAFTQSERVDGSLVRGAPHCMELSYWAQGWYARCFGFSLECSTSVRVRN